MKSATFEAKKEQSKFHYVYPPLLFLMVQKLNSGPLHVDFSVTQMTKYYLYTPLLLSRYNLTGFEEVIRRISDDSARISRSRNRVLTLSRSKTRKELIPISENGNRRAYRKGSEPVITAKNIPKETFRGSCRILYRYQIVCNFLNFSWSKRKSNFSPV